MVDKYKRLTDRLATVKTNLEVNEDIILSVNEIAFLDKLLCLIGHFINGELE